MTDSPACPACGKTLHKGEEHCPACGTPRPGAVLTSGPDEGATWVMSPPPDVGEGADLQPFAIPEGPPYPVGPAPNLLAGEDPEPASEQARDQAGQADGWQEVREQLEEATRGEFEIQSELGRGGMAAVYLARDLALGRNVAIKVMAPGLLMGPGMVDRFRQEAVTIAALHHPNIVTIHTVRHIGRLHFFVMQVVDGGSLENLLKGPDPLPVPLIQVILFQVGTGLSFAHRHGVIHRDIKPANVLLDGEGNAILTDFGIAKVATAGNLTQTGSTMGTPSYMSPEQCRAGELSSASDQYSLGIVAYEMLAGVPPFSGSAFEIMQAHNSEAPEGLRNRRPDCPPELEAAILRMLAKNPEDRFPSVAEAMEAIGGYLPGPRDPVRRELVRLARLGTSDSSAIPGPSGPDPFAPTVVAPGKGPASVSEPKPDRSARTENKPAWSRPRVLVGGAIAFAVIAIAVLASLQRWAFSGSESGATATAAPNTVSFPSVPEVLMVGETTRIRVLVQNPDGVPVTGEAISWSSSDTTIVRLEGLGEEVLVEGLTPGFASVQASSAGAIGTFTLPVSEPSPGQLTVSTPRREILIGEAVTLSGILLDSRGEPVPDASIAWSSSDPGVIEVNRDTGVATGQGLGSARLTASSGDRTGAVTIRVLGQVEAITVVPPVDRLVDGTSMVIRASLTSRPIGYLGAGGITWISSNPSVVTVSSSEGDSAVLNLLDEGEATLTARADAVEGIVTLRVEPSPPAISLSLYPVSISFEAVEDGPSPEERAVEVLVTGDASPSVGVVDYVGGARGWLRQSLGIGSGDGMVLTVRVDHAGLNPGTYSARIPIGAGGQSRVLDVQLTVAPDPGPGPIEPSEAAAQEIATLLGAYLGALNTKNTRRVLELFPSLSQSAIDELLRLPSTDQYYLALRPGSLRAGAEQNTLDGDVMSGVVGPNGQGELRLVVYTFSRGDQGWFIVSFRAGG